MKGNESEGHFWKDVNKISSASMQQMSQKEDMFIINMSEYILHIMSGTNNVCSVFSLASNQI